MKGHSCISVGIKGYRFFKPLNYAQQDAEEFYRYCQETGLIVNPGFLLTDTAPEVDGVPAYPTRENILNCLERASQTTTPSALVWFFFSGYGVNHGGQDYLIPIDGNPEKPQQSGISVNLLLDRLQQIHASSVLALLDMNRSQLGQVESNVGAATMELANAMTIPTILSCRPDQLSRETSALRQGFFTTALLEGLRTGQGHSVTDLYQFLSRRLPELTEQHLRPQQNPILVMNPSRKIDQLVPSTAISAGVGAKLGAGVEPAAGLSRSSRQDIASLQPNPDQSAQATPNAIQMGREKASSQSFLQQLILWSGLVALLLLFGVFYANRNLLMNRQPDTASVSSGQQPSEPVESSVDNSPAEPVIDDTTPEGSPTPGSSVSTESEAERLANEKVLGQARSVLQSSSAASWSNAIGEASKIPPTDPLYSQAQEDIARWSQTILDIAQGRAQVNNFADAIAAAELIPNQNQTLYTQAQLQIQKWDQKQEQLNQNQAQLKAAQSQTKRGQSATYRKAIDEASKIPEDQPGYAEAQQSINQWGAAILEIAQAQARRKRWNQAIQSAGLVPEGTVAYQEAQAAIAQWQSRLEK
ncbi:MAG: caspase family protein [Microcoleaceae cyanobacterium]